MESSGTGLGFPARPAGAKPAYKECTGACELYHPPPLASQAKDVRDMGRKFYAFWLVESIV